jgi:hypothetical protein
MENFKLHEKLEWMNNRIEEFSSTALRERAPQIRIVKEIPAEAKTSFWHKDILIRQNLISRWEKGDIGENYVETVLAHEMGHVIDLDRGIHSAYLQLNIVTVLGFGLLILFGVFAFQANSWLGVSFILGGGTFFLWSYRNRQRASEFRADKSAFQLIREKRKIEETYHTLMEEQQAIISGCYGQRQKIKAKIYLCFFPSFQERLRKLGFEEN